MQTELMRAAWLERRRYGGFTLVDFNRLRRATPDAAVPIAAGIFLDIFNVFLFFIELFGGSRRS